MKQKKAQPSLNDLFEYELVSKMKRTAKKTRYERAEIRRVEPSVPVVDRPRTRLLNALEPRQLCHEWMLWLLQCGLIERSHWPVSHSGLYTDFT
jgi:hypothetical protein